MNECHLFDEPNMPEGVRVYQVTDDPERASLIYPDRPSFLADGRRFVVNTSSGPAVCDPDDNFALRPLFGDGAPRGLRLTYDGRYAYFNRRGKDEGGLTLARIDLDTGDIEDLFHAADVLPGTDVPAEKFRIATVSADNRRVAAGVYLGDGETPDAPFAIMAIDLERGSVHHVIEHRDFPNPHLQYCRSEEPEAMHDLLVQMNHGSSTNAEGKLVRGQGPPSDKGVDLHVIRDDGTHWRDLPFGRDGEESCIGHQVWRGRTRAVATVTLQNRDTSYGWAEGSRQEVVAGWPLPADPEQPHMGRLSSGAQRVRLSEGFEDPRFCHLACDATGLKFALDTFPIFDGKRAGMQVYYASAPDEMSPLTFRYILNTGVTFNAANGYHAHPILSPDASMLLFNSNITGKPQAYMVTGFAD